MIQTRRSLDDEAILCKRSTQYEFDVEMLMCVVVFYVIVFVGRGARLLFTTASYLLIDTGFKQIWQREHATRLFKYADRTKSNREKLDLFVSVQRCINNMQNGSHDTMTCPIPQRAMISHFLNAVLWTIIFFNL